MILSRTGRLDLLADCFDQILAPPEVMEEFGPSPEWIFVTEVHDTAMRSVLQLNLHKGEAAAICVALENPGSIIVVDDRKARKTALHLGIKMMGTVGLLIRAKHLGLVSEIRPLLDEFLLSGLFLDRTIYRKALEIVGEPIHLIDR